MVMFVDQDKMSPAQLALETARYELAGLHGGTISWPERGTPNYVIDTSEAIQRIDAALKSLAKPCDKET